MTNIKNTLKQFDIGKTLTSEEARERIVGTRDTPADEDLVKALVIKLRKVMADHQGLPPMEIIDEFFLAIIDSGWGSSDEVIARLLANGMAMGYLMAKED